MFFTKYENLCKNSKKTTTGVAAELGVAKSTVAYWRANNNVIPKQDVLLKIANYFNVSVDYLLGSDKKEKPSDVERLTFYAYHDSEESSIVEKNLSLENIEALNALLKSARDLSPDKIAALIQVAENMK